MTRRLANIICKVDGNRKRAKKRETTLKHVDIDKCKKPKLTGKGAAETSAILSSQGRVDAIGQQNLFGNARLPEFLEQGRRHLGQGEAGSERFLFNPTRNIQHFITNMCKYEVRPQNSIAPMTDQNITVTINQQPGTFIDPSDLVVEMKCKMFHDGAPWTADAPDLKYQKRISVINNAAASLFKNISLRINGQEISTSGEMYAIKDYFQTTFLTSQQVYNNGDLIRKGFFKETPGGFHQTVCVEPQGGGALECAKNPARAKMCDQFYKGKECFLSFQPILPLTQQIRVANQTNKYELTFERSDPAFYLLGKNDATVTDVETVIQKCDIRITDFKIKVTSLEISKENMAKYVQTYTEDNPDTYLFTHHAMMNFSIQQNASLFEQEISGDKIPDKIAMTLINKNAKLGVFGLNPFEFYKLPKDSDFQFFINKSSIHTSYLKNDREAYDRQRKTLSQDLRDPLITYEDFLFNASADGANSGYTAYCDTLTFTTRNRDGSINEDQRSGALQMYIQLAPNKQIDQNLEFCIHKFDTRQFSISPTGQIAKDFI